MSCAAHDSELAPYIGLPVGPIVGEYVESWKKWVKLFEILVIIGVAGELLADGGSFLVSKQLQSISDQEGARLISHSRPHHHYLACIHADGLGKLEISV